MTEPTAPVTWQVTGQTQRIRANDTNGVEQGYDVSFVTGAGHAGSVFVPDARYNTEYVRALISQQAAKLDAVGALTSGN